MSKLFKKGRGNYVTEERIETFRSVSGEFAIVLLAVLIVGSLVACSKEPPEPKEVGVQIMLDEGWTDESTPAIFYFESVDEGTEAFAHAINPAEDGDIADSVQLLPGKYTVKVISPINPDGSVYSINEGTERQVITTMDLEIEENSSTTISTNMRLIPVEEVTEDMLTSVADEVKSAVETESLKTEEITNDDDEIEIVYTGDETLTGDNGAAILEKVNAVVK